MYHKILAAREKLESLVHHAAFGANLGFVGTDAGQMGANVNQYVGYGGVNGNMVHDAGGRLSSYAGARNPLRGRIPGIPAGLGGPHGAASNAADAASGVDPQGIAKAITPQGGFQAKNPNIVMDTGGLQGAESLGLGTFNQGLGNTQAAIGQLGNEAGNIGQSAAGLNDVYSQQGTLAKALQAQAQGQGPNPALMQFNQNTNRNIEQQAGAIASQKGINPALAARMISQQGAQANAGAAGQAGMMQAQQQLAAQQQLGQQQAAMAGTLGQQGNLYKEAGSLFGTAGGLGQGMTGAGNNLYGTGVQGMGAQNQAVTTGELGAQSLNQKTAAENAALKSRTQMGIMQGLGAGVGMAGSYFLPPGGGAAEPAAANPNDGAPAPDTPDASGAYGLYAHGGTVDDQALTLARALRDQGGSVPGKAKMAGDHAENDTVPTALSPGEIVIPRSISQGPDAAEKAAEFVEKLKGKAHPTYGRVLQARRRLADAMEAHQACGGMAS